MKVHWSLILLVLFLLSGCRLPADDSFATQFPFSTSPKKVIGSNDLATPTFDPPPYTPDRFPSCQPAPGVEPYKIKNLPIDIVLTPSAVALRELARRQDFFVGTSAAPELLSDPEYSRLLASELNMVTPENAMKWEIIHPQPDKYDFSSGDLLVDYARQHNMSVRGHVLVWDLQMPAWVTQAQYPRSEWTRILCEHIKTVIGHYKGVVYAWDVVNEAVNNDGTLRDTFWMERIGPEHIAMAFQWAREADPGAKLFYNDNGGEGLNPKSQAIYMLVRGLIQESIPIDGVGLQMHTALYLSPPPAGMAKNIQRLGDLDLEIHITEMDVRLQNSTEPEPARLAAQAEVYRQVISTCLESPHCKGFVTWGLTDRYSWIPEWTGNPDAPLLFDYNGKPKPAYFAIREALSSR